MSRRRGLFGLSFETIGSVSAIVVGLAALFVSWDQARVMRAQQHASVLPAIQIDGYFGEFEDGARLGARVSNNGVGPAVVRSVSLSRGGAPVVSPQTVTAIFPDSVDISWSSMIGRILAAGAVVEPITVRVPADGSVTPELAGQFVADWLSFDLDLCYCSVFDRCWVATTRDDAAPNAPVDACPDAGGDIFEEIGFSSRNMTRTDP